MDDKELIAAIIKGDREAFDSLTVKYYQGLCLFAESILDEQEVVKDVVQEAFVYLWEKRKKMEEIVSVKSYLYTSVRNYCFMYLRSRKLRPRMSGLPEPSEEDVHYHYVKAETIRLLSGAIDSLPPRTGEVIRLTLDGLRQEKIAESMEVTVATVKALKAEGIRKMRKILGDKRHLFRGAFLLYGSWTSRYSAAAGPVATDLLRSMDCRAR